MGIKGLMYKPLLKSTSNIDFRKEIWIKFNLKDSSLINFSGSPKSDYSIQVENNANRPLGLSKG